MAKKMAVIAVEFDDDENDITDCSELATVATVALEKAGFTGVDVTVYSSPEALASDTAEGYGIFADGRANPAEQLPVVAGNSPAA